MATTVTISGTIAAPPEAVFRLYTDPARRSEWNPAARGIVEQTGPLNEPGTRYVVDTRFGPFEVHVLRIEPPLLIEMLEGVGRRGEAHVTLHFKPTGDGRTKLIAEQTLTASGRLERLIAPLWARLSWVYGQLELRRLRSVAERDARSDSPSTT